MAVSYLSYCKKRKRKASKARMLKRRMIRLLEQPLIQRDEIHKEYGTALRYTQDYQKRLSIIRKILVQEKEIFEGKKVSDRIVSIDRHYIRPIVKGKETKSVERLATYRWMAYRLSNPSPSRPSMRVYGLRDCIRMQQKLMNVRIRCVAADSIYANNANRKFCTNMGYPHPLCVREGRPKMSL